jgi:Zn-dependent metalloprotease
MRKTLGLAATAVLATATFGVQATTATSTASAAPSPGIVASALTALQQHPGAALDAPGQAFAATHTIADADGTSHVRMQRTVGGVPVLGGDLVVHEGPGAAFEGVSQTLTAPLELSLEPVVAAAGAVSTALAPGALTKTISGLVQDGAPRLVVDAYGAKPVLAWEVISGGVQANGTPSRMATYVDARTGAVLRREEQIENVDGTGNTLYSGAVPLNVTQSGSSFQLKDASRGGTYTVDVTNKTDGGLCAALGMGCATGSVVSSTTTTFGNSTTADRKSAAAEAQYGTDATWDYYQQVHGRNGIFGTGKGSYNRVHYGKNYVNAFWDGEKMTYGDGDGTNYGPLVSLDVAGHEMSHGVTENSAALTYSGESGGLNEATSDIFGTMVEFFENNASDPGDYLIGEEFDLKNHVGLRRMDNPASDGASQNCYTSGTKNLDVHYSSGVGNHFFYLLAEGSGAKTIGGTAHSSPTCNGSTITGIGRDAAQKIWYRALTVYMTSGTTYAGARTATLNAAKDLYGQTSSQYATVGAAWSAVSVG